jgi:hypothetical protein
MQVSLNQRPDIAKTIWYKVYTIGIGTKWQGFHTRLDQMVSFIQMMKVEIDEQLMKSIIKQMVVILELQVTTNWLKYMAIIN